MPISLQTIATACGVSSSTVSRALADPPRGRMSDEVRDRIRTFAAQHGYSVNPTARSLRLRRTESLMLVLPPYFSCLPMFPDFDAHVRLIQWEMVFGITDAAAQNGYDIRLTPLRKEELEKPKMRFDARHGDGAIFLFAMQRFPGVCAAIQPGFPYLSVDFTSNEYDCDLRADFRAGYFEAIADIKARGEKRIGLMFHSGEKHSDRQLCFLLPELEKAGFNDIRHLNIASTLDIRQHVAAGNHRGLDVMFCLNDTTASLLDEELSFACPGEAHPRIIGMDENPVYQKLSTIGFPRKMIAEEAVRRLLRRIEGANPEPGKIFPSYYTKRS